MEEKQAELVYEIVSKEIQLEYVVTKCYYILAPAKGAYLTLKDKKTKAANMIYLYFVCIVTFVVGRDNSINKMDKVL